MQLPPNSKVPQDRKCKAKARTTGNQCGNYPLPGQDICRMHGGSAPQNLEKAAIVLRTRKIEEDVYADLAHEGIEAVEDPLQELGKLASSSKALMEALGARVNSLDQLEHFDAKNSPAIKAEVQMYERAMDRTHRLLDSLVRHGYTERTIQIQESEAMLVAGVLKRVISALGLTSEQQRQAQSLLAQEFRMLTPRAVPAAG